MFADTLDMHLRRLSLRVMYIYGCKEIYLPLIPSLHVLSLREANNAVCYDLDVCVCVCVIPLAVSAQERDWLGSHEKDGPYLGLSAGWLHLTDLEGNGATAKYDEGFIIGIQGGYKLGVIRGELEFEYGRSGADSIEIDGVGDFDAEGDFDLFRWTTGLYYDFDNLTNYTPYLGGGLGGVYASGDEVTVAGVTFEFDDELYFTAHGEAGLAVEIVDQISVVPAYRFIWIDSSEDDLEDDTAHVAKLGLRVHF